MWMNFRNALLAASLMALPVAANAQAVTGPYIGFGAGVNLMQDEHGSFSSAFGSGSGDLKTTVGPAFVASVGYGFGNGLRAEIEGDYRHNSFNGVSGGGSGGLGAGGSEQKAGGMFNVLYDFVGVSPSFVPYVGVGAGYQTAIEHNVYVSSPGTIVSVDNGGKGAFAYQGIVGAAIPIAMAPGFALTAEYRFLGLAGNRNYSTSTVSGVIGPVPGSAKFDDDYNHSFLVGFRYNFGVAAAVVTAAAATPAPAVQPARSYLVFFDWDKATLTDRARSIIKEAADNSTHVQYTRIEVNGYTDTSGTPQYNQGLSIRRAQAVAAELVHDGVPQGAITAQGFGETHLLVATGPGVREPQNRRV
jgi:outer membrane protein OmpA-like peptidoglycan-associated protein/outer membrane protein W